MWKVYNANPERKTVGDCVIRALSKALGRSWADTYIGICDKGLKMHDMPSSNAVWGVYLREQGYTKHMVNKEYPERYHLKDFCEEHPSGTFVVVLSGHVVCVRNGDYYDSWDSGSEIPIYYYRRSAK